MFLAVIDSDSGKLSPLVPSTVMFWLKNGQVQGSLGVKNPEHWPWSLWYGESSHGPPLRSEMVRRWSDYQSPALGLVHVRDGVPVSRASVVQ